MSEHPSPAAAPPHFAPSVSVVLPVYNGLATLGRALASIQAQTYPGVSEIIVVDDGSDEDTAAFLAERFPGVRYLRQEHTGIPGAARNRGVAAATGEFVAFLDADDEWLPDKLARQIAAIAAEPDLRFVLTRAYTHALDDALHDPGPAPQPSPWRPDLERWLSYGFRRRLHLHTSPSSWLVSRAAWEALGGQDTAWPDNGDWHMVTRALLAGIPLAIVMEPAYIYHCNLGSQSHRLVRQDLAAQARRVVDFVQSLRPDATANPQLSPALHHRLLYGEARTYGRFLLRYGYPGTALAMYRLAWGCRVSAGESARLLPYLALLPLLAGLPEPWGPWCRLTCALRDLKWSLLRARRRGRAGFRAPGCE